ncbi:MAG: tyrosine-protein phosphatase [Aggregatilineales bacterium]
MPIAVLVLLGLLLTGVWIARRRRLPLGPDPSTLILPLPPDAADAPPRAGGAVTGRFVPLAGAPNFRDLGGYAAANGRRVRWGQVYRAGALADLTDADLELLSALGVRLVCDLRSAEEVEESPDRLPAHNPPAYWHLPATPVDSKETQRQRLRAVLLDRSRLRTLLLEFYTTTMIDDNASLYRAVFERLADPDNLPAVIHCTAGKDRAGMVSAMLLLALGVPEETVIADYTQSNRFYDHFARITQRSVRPLRALGVSVSDIYPLLIAHPDTLRAALAYLRERYGSVEAYLREKAGVDDATLARLRENLLA